MNHVIFTSSLLLTLCTGTLKAKESQLLEDFHKGKPKLSWQSVNDGVMGGLSQGKAIVKKSSIMAFVGEISLENNGGFSSIRTFGETSDLSAYTGVELKLRGDGRTYYVTLRSPDKKRIAYWRAITPAKGKWQSVKVPFDSFYATWFGKKIPGMRLSTDNVSSVGFMLYDKKAGKFQLEVDTIKCYR